MEEELVVGWIRGIFLRWKRFRFGQTDRRTKTWRSKDRLTDIQGNGVTEWHRRQNGEKREQRRGRRRETWTQRGRARERRRNKERNADRDRELHGRRQRAREWPHIGPKQR